MQSTTTPMMKQYLGIKKDYKDCLLLYRMGDFYELFQEDAHIGSQVLNITLTSKSNGKSGRVPMAGVPYHAVDNYIAKLVKAGYKVAICEQMSPPNKHGLVEREVVRIVTPGTMLDERALEQKNNNYIISLLINENNIALSIADLSTGYFATTQLKITNMEQQLIDELSRISPSECLLPEELYNDATILKLLKTQPNMNITSFKEWENYSKDARKFLTNHFKVKTLSVFGIEENNESLQTAAALLGYLQQTQKTTVQHIQKIFTYAKDDTMSLDKSTMINLELFSTIREHDTKGSLLSILDQTSTAMGGRMLKQWLKKPLTRKNEITYRHDGVEELLINTKLRKKISQHLEIITDVERILSRLSVNIGNARDMINLKNSLEQIMAVKTIIRHSALLPAGRQGDAESLNANIFKHLSEGISPKIDEIINYIKLHIVDEPPIDLRNGGMIRIGVNKELDNLRLIINDSKSFIAELERKEKDATGISSLKIRFNQVFGFYIEISKGSAHLAPKHYMRKQTLVNGERFITEDLKKHEEIILTAEEKTNELEYQLFQKIVEHLLSFIKYVQRATDAIATLDCITTFAKISHTNNYIRPKLLYSGEIRIQQGRHPVVEKLLESNNQFVPNDLALDNINRSLLIITGPNMAGKSVFIRQVALIVLMNQIGCFVPAKSAHLSIMDRIFVRSGASDVITSGLSTFMVEMVETAHILHNATSNSLIIMDEIGRGTSTYDGISIAWAVASYLVTKFKPAPKVLFATHYHELQELEQRYPKNIKNFHMAVTESKGEPNFLHTLMQGGASHSFGVAVAKLAGVPAEVVENANNMLQKLEEKNRTVVARPQSGEATPKQPVILGRSGTTTPESLNEKPLRDSRLRGNDETSVIVHLIQKELENVDIANMTPLEAMNKLAELKEQIKLLTDKTKREFIEAD